MILTRKSSVFYSTYFFIYNIFLTYFISSLLKFHTNYYTCLSYTLDAGTYIHLHITFKCFVILLELITILKDRGSAWSGLEMWFRVCAVLVAHGFGSYAAAL